MTLGENSCWADAPSHFLFTMPAVGGEPKRAIRLGHSAGPERVAELLFLSLRWGFLGGILVWLTESILSAGM